MVRRASRTSSVRKVARRTSKGVKKAYVKKGSKNKLRCSACGFSKIYKNGKVSVKRRPQRPYAAALCHRCLDAVIRYRARLEDGSIGSSDVPAHLLGFVI